MSLLQNPPAHSISIHDTTLCPSMSLLIADSGATNHMIPDKSAFISYYPVLGHGFAWAMILSCQSLVMALPWSWFANCLHICDLRNPLYSLQVHQHQQGCGLIGMFGFGMFVFFPTFILKADTATDCHLWYKPIGRQTNLDQLDYVQPKFLQYQSVLMATAPLSTPVIIEPKDDDNADVTPTYAFHWPKKASSPKVT